MRSLKASSKPGKTVGYAQQAEGENSLMKYARALMTAVMVVAFAGVAQANTIVALPGDAGGATPVGVEGQFAPGWGSGSWQSPNGGGWTQFNFDAQSLFGRDITVGEIASMSYWTNKPTGPGSVDWYFHIYTAPYDGSPGAGWYGNRINAEPYFSENLNAPADQWNQWQTGEGEDNRLRFYDSSNNDFGGYDDGFLSDLTSDPDYADQQVLFFSFATGSAWADSFTGLLDGFEMTLTDNSYAAINFEAHDGVGDPAVIPVPPAAGLILLGMAGMGLRRKFAKK